MWLSNAVAGVPLSIWYQYVDPPQWTGLAAHGAVQLDWTGNTLAPHTPKPAFEAAAVLQQHLGEMACRGRFIATSAAMGAATWRPNPQAFVVGFNRRQSTPGQTPAAVVDALAVWLTDVMPDDGLQCADITSGERRQCAADQTQAECEEAGCCWNASVKLPP